VSHQSLSDRYPAAVYRGPNDIGFEQRAVPEPGPDEVLVRVAVCGICGSDATEYARGPVLARPPVVLGHEFAGTVVRVGTGVEGFPSGASVVAGAGIACGDCRMCQSGRTNLCTSYSTLGLQHDGGLQGYVVAPASTLLDVTATGLPMDTLGLAQPMSIAVHTVRRSGLKDGMDAVIVGVGGIGSFITVAAAAVGARVLVVDRDVERLELAMTLGALASLVAGESSLSDRLAELGMEPDVFFEVSGSRPGFDSVLEAARPGATIVPVGIQKAPVDLQISDLTMRELTIVGTVAHVFGADLPEAVRLLGTRADWSDIAGEVIPLGDLVTNGIVPLVDGSARQIKTLIDPWASESRPAAHRRE
jgi:(R,R)-butanediol dehydrogenase/meso-butanediol dehydrogenase/diacetyl reductase